MLRSAAVSRCVPILLCLLFASAPIALATSYSTSFRSGENPISEDGKWINGQTVGLDWTNVSTTTGLAFGTQSGSSNSNDSIALLTGAWGADQTVQATVRTINQSDDFIEEVQLRLRNTLGAHTATGYAITFRCSKTGNAYARIVKWNGPLGRVTVLKLGQGSQYGVANGDVVKATIVGSIITAYVNGAQVLQTSDSSYTSGSPGMGFSLQGATGVNGDYGFADFTASDQSTSQKQLSTSATTATASGNSYTTNFPLTENAISEGGKWINGGSVGLDWSNVRTTANTKAWGTQVPGTAAGQYNDSIAVLNPATTGAWGPNQTVQGKAADVAPGYAGEMELLLRGTITAHSAKLYEVDCASQLLAIAKWKGPLGGWRWLHSSNLGSCPYNGTVKATITGTDITVITVWINGVQVAKVTDCLSSTPGCTNPDPDNIPPYTTGTPGIGFFIAMGQPVSDNQYVGWANFTASDGGSGTPSPTAPTNLSAVVH